MNLPPHGLENLALIYGFRPGMPTATAPWSVFPGERHHDRLHPPDFSLRTESRDERHPGSAHGRLAPECCGSSKLPVTWVHRSGARYVEPSSFILIHILNAPRTYSPNAGVMENPAREWSSMASECRMPVSRTTHFIPSTRASASSVESNIFPTLRPRAL